MSTFNQWKPALLLAIQMVAPVAIAQTPPPAPNRPTITVSEEATVTTAPDRAEIDIGVVTQAVNAKEAANQNAARVRTVIDQIKRAIGPAATVQTVGYSISPDYRYKEGSPPTISGYTARNTVRVATDNLSEIGPAIDAATRNGANEVHRLEYMLKNDDVASGRALEQAARGARAKADALARALGVKITRIFQAVETQPTQVRPMMMAFKSAAQADTPIEASTIDVHATVTLTVEIAP